MVTCQILKSLTWCPVTDRTYPLSEVTEAIRHVETDHARAKVVITVS